MPSAIRSLELKYISNLGKTESELESYYFLKNQILGVSNGYKKSTETRQKIVIFLGSSNAILSIFLIVALTLLTKQTPLGYILNDCFLNTTASVFGFLCNNGMVFTSISKNSMASDKSLAI